MIIVKALSVSISVFTMVPTPPVVHAFAFECFDDEGYVWIIYIFFTTFFFFIFITLLYGCSVQHPTSPTVRLFSTV